MPNRRFVPTVWIQAILLILATVIPDQSYAKQDVFKIYVCGHSDSAAKNWSRSSSKEKKALKKLSRDYKKYLKEAPKAQHSSYYRIPKKIHFIWIGPKPFPPESIKNLLAWKKHHPSWEFIFWTDSKHRPTPIDGMTKRIVHDYNFGDMEPYISASDNYGEKSDLMRYAILYNEGGIYADHDCDCLNPFDTLNKMYDFYAGLEYLHYHEGIDAYVLPANGLFGAKARHPILREAMNRVMLKWDEVSKKFPKAKDFKKRVIQRTWDPFAFAAMQYRNSFGTRDLILPTVAFYPNRIFNHVQIEQLAALGFIFSIHGFAGSWAH